jgi:hypothetical protein
MSGNWGSEFVDHVRSRRPWRTRILMTVVSIVAGVALVVLIAQFWGGRAEQLPGTLIVIVILLALGIVFGLRPWARK